MRLNRRVRFFETRCIGVLERLRPDGSLDTGMPVEARDLAMASLRSWCLTVLPGTLLQTRTAK